MVYYPILNFKDFFSSDDQSHSITQTSTKSPPEFKTLFELKIDRKYFPPSFVSFKTNKFFGKKSNVFKRDIFAKFW